MGAEYEVMCDYIDGYSDTKMGDIHKVAMVTGGGSGEPWVTTCKGRYRLDTFLVIFQPI